MQACTSAKTQVLIPLKVLEHWIRNPCSNPVQTPLSDHCHWFRFQHCRHAQDQKDWDHTFRKLPGVVVGATSRLTQSCFETVLYIHRGMFEHLVGVYPDAALYIARAITYKQLQRLSDTCVLQTSVVLSASSQRSPAELPLSEFISWDKTCVGLPVLPGACVDLIFGVVPLKPPDDVEVSASGVCLVAAPDRSVMGTVVHRVIRLAFQLMYPALIVAPREKQELWLAALADVLPLVLILTPGSAVHDWEAGRTLCSFVLSSQEAWIEVTERGHVDTVWSSLVVDEVDALRLTPLCGSHRDLHGKGHCSPSRLFCVRRQTLF